MTKAHNRSRGSGAKASPYSSKIIKAGALLADTKTLLSQWDVELPMRDNLERLRRENLFAKASRSRVDDILAIFRQRYLLEDQVTRALVLLVKHSMPTAAMDRILLFHAARADHLLRDVVSEYFLPMYSQGLVDVSLLELERHLASWVHEGKTVSTWGEITLRRVAQELLATLRDFGVLQGNNNKKIAPSFLPMESFAYMAFYLKQHQPSGAKLLELPDWKLFFLSRDSVERFLFEAHQRHLLEYHVAGNVTRLTFPAETLEEYANVLAQR